MGGNTFKTSAILQRVDLVLAKGIEVESLATAIGVDVIPWFAENARLVVFVFSKLVHS
jgi:hypothetical protein